MAEDGIKVRIFADDKEFNKAVKRAEATGQKLIAKQKDGSDKITKVKLVNISKVEKKQLDSIAKTSKARSKANTEAVKGFDKLKTAFKVGVGLVAAKRLTSSVLGLAKSANTAENAIRGMAAIVQNKLGKEALPEAEKALSKLTASGLLNKEDAAKAIQNLVATGFAIEDATKIIERNVDIAVTSRQSHLTLSEAVKVFTEGVKNQNSVLSDATGISTNLSTMLKRQGFALEDLTSKQKGTNARAALFRSIMEETAPFVGQAADESDKFGGKLARMETNIKKLEVVFGKFLGEVLGPFLELITKAVVAIGGLFTGLNNMEKTMIVATPAVLGLAAAFGVMSGGLTLIVPAIALVVTGITNLVTSQDRFDEKVKKATKNLPKLNNEYLKLSTNANRTAEQTRRLKEVQQELGVLVPGFNNSLKESNGVLETNTELMNKNTEAIQKRIKETRTFKTLTDLSLLEQKASLEKSIGVLQPALNLPKVSPGVIASYQTLQTQLIAVKKALSESEVKAKDFGNAVGKAGDSFTDKLASRGNMLEGMTIDYKKLIDLQQRLNAGLSGFRDTLKGINEKEIGDTITGLGKMSSAVPGGELVGDFVQGLGATINILDDINGLMADTKVQEEDIEAIVQRVNDLNEHRLETLESEYNIKKNLLELEQERQDLEQKRSEEERGIDALFGGGLEAQRSSIRQQLATAINDSGLSSLLKGVGLGKGTQTQIGNLGGRAGQSDLVSAIVSTEDAQGTLQKIENIFTGLGDITIKDDVVKLAAAARNAQNLIEELPPSLRATSQLSVDNLEKVTGQWLAARTSADEAAARTTFANMTANFQRSLLPLGLTIDSQEQAVDDLVNIQQLSQDLIKTKQELDAEDIEKKKELIKEETDMINNLKGFNVWAKPIVEEKKKGQFANLANMGDFSSLSGLGPSLGNLGNFGSLGGLGNMGNLGNVAGFGGGGITQEIIDNIAAYEEEQRQKGLAQDEADRVVNQEKLLASLQLLVENSDLNLREIEKFGTDEKDILERAQTEQIGNLTNLFKTTGISFDKNNLESIFSNLIKDIQESNDPLQDEINRLLLDQVDIAIQSKEDLDEIVKNTDETKIALKDARRESIIDIGSGLVSGLRGAFQTPTISGAGLTVPSQITNTANALTGVSRTEFESNNLQLLTNISLSNQEIVDILERMEQNATGDTGNLLQNLIIKELGEIAEKTI